MDGGERAIVLFDGECNLCNGSVRFIAKRDGERFFGFASLQSEAGRALLRDRGVELPAGVDSVVLVEGPEVYTHSTAALRIARRLRGPWRLMALLIVVPRSLRDAVYQWIARNRMRWFGRADSCSLPGAAP